MATHSGILAWRMPWTDEPGRLQSTGLQKDMTEQLMLTLSIEVKVSMQVCGSNSSLLGIYHRDLKSGSQKVICTLMFITALFTITKV